MHQKLRIPLVCLLVFLLLSPSVYSAVDFDQNMALDNTEMISSALEDPFSTGNDPIEICFIDVGQGDSILIKTKTSAVLIDGGDEEHASSISHTLQQNGVRHLDMIVATHVHEDHIGGLPEIINKFAVTTVLSPVYDFDSAAFKKLSSALDAQHGTVKVPSVGDTIPLGDSAMLEVLGPLRDSEIINNTSLILRLTFGSFHALFTGDAEMEEEKDILGSSPDLESAILKVGHHGSSSSSSADWLKAISPQTAIISCGAGNRYGYPDPDVLQQFRDIHCPVYRTDHHGTIRVSASLNGSYQCIPERYFTDVADEKWYSDSISFCAVHGFVSGYSDGSFYPGKAITREEFAAVMNRVLSLNEPATNTYTDVKPERWYTLPVLNCVKVGILTGYGNHTIGVGDPLTREQAAVILAKAFRFPLQSGPTVFTDAGAISHWAKGAVYSLSQYGLLSGMPDGSFRPKEKLTRAQMCVLIRACLQQEKLSAVDT